MFNVSLSCLVEANATTRLSNARLYGDTTYDPSIAITVYHAQARNEVAAANSVVPLTTSLLQHYTTASAQRYLAAIITADVLSNTTALQTMAQAPQTMSPAVSRTMVDLRPYTHVCRSVERFFVPHVSCTERQSHRRSLLFFSSFSAARFLLFILLPFKRRNIHRGSFEFSLFGLTSKATFTVSGSGSQYGPCARGSSPDLCFLFAHPHRHTSDGLSPSKP